MNVGDPIETDNNRNNACQHDLMCQQTGTDNDAEILQKMKAVQEIKAELHCAIHGVKNRLPKVADIVVGRLVDGCDASSHSELCHVCQECYDTRLLLPCLHQICSVCFKDIKRCAFEDRKQPQCVECKEIFDANQVVPVDPNPSLKACDCEYCTPNSFNKLIELTRKLIQRLPQLIDLLQTNQNDQDKLNQHKDKLYNEINEAFAPIIEKVMSTRNFVRGLHERMSTLRVSVVDSLSGKLKSLRLDHHELEQAQERIILWLKRIEALVSSNCKSCVKHLMTLGASLSSQAFRPSERIEDLPWFFFVLPTEPLKARCQEIGAIQLQKAVLKSHSIFKPASLSTPSSIATLSRDRLVVVDEGDKHVKIFSLLPAFQSKLLEKFSVHKAKPLSVATTNSGNIWITTTLPDALNCYSNGMIIHEISLRGARDVTICKDIVVATCDRGVYAFDANMYTLCWHSSNFNYPCGIATVQDNELVICDSNNHRLQVLDRHGIHQQNIGVGIVRYPQAVAMIPNSNQIVVGGLDTMYIFSLDGELVCQWKAVTCVLGGIAILPNGRIAVSQKDGCIRMY